GPGADRSPAFGSLIGILREIAEDTANAFLPAVAVIRFEVAVVSSGEGVTVFENHFDRPTAGFVAARGFGGVVVRDRAFDIGNPALGDLDVGFGSNGVVAAEAQAGEGGNGLWRF